MDSSPGEVIFITISLPYVNALLTHYSFSFVDEFNSGKCLEYVHKYNSLQKSPLRLYF